MQYNKRSGIEINNLKGKVGQFQYLLEIRNEYILATVFLMLV